MYPLASTGLVTLTQVVPQAAGPLALVPILAPHLLLLNLLLVPVALAARDRLLVVALALSGAAAVMLLGDEWISLPSPADEPSIAFVSWNLQLGSRSPADAVEALHAEDADVIALQELTGDISAAIDADPILRARFPHRVLEPDRTVFGLGLLSNVPIVDHHLERDPVSLTARLSLDDGTVLSVLNAHPMPGDIDRFSFDGRPRDAELRTLRRRVDALLSSGGPLVVLGDLNVASSEPSYATFARGLRDAHREAGFGPGWTWRPERLIRFGVGVLRIDYVLGSHQIAPRTIEVDCHWKGDHCLVRATLSVEPSDRRF